jgi:hypothetical protein
VVIRRFANLPVSPRNSTIRALCGNWANSKSFRAGSRPPRRPRGSAGHTADSFDRNVGPDSDLI